MAARFWTDAVKHPCFRGRFMALVLLAIAVSAGVVAAHATLRRSEPPNGGRVSVPPAQLLLEFSEAVVARTSRVDLVAPDSQRLGLEVNGDSSRPRVLLAAVPPLTVSGPYRVEWRLIGPDGHAVTGKYGFVIDSIPVMQPDTAITVPVEQHEAHEPPSDAVGQQAIRFASALALAMAVGSIAFALYVLPGVGRGDGALASYRAGVDDRLRSLGTMAGWSILILAGVRLVSHATTLSGSIGALRISDLADLIASSTFGRGWLLMVLASVALVGVLRRNSPARWRFAAVAATALAVASAMLGHPAAVTEWHVLSIGLDATHALAAGGWAGGILVLTVAALPEMVRRPGENQLTLARNLLRSFSPMALTCAAILATTGVASAWLQLRNLGLVLHSPYGLALLRKVVVVLMIAALGAYHWRVAQPSLDTERSLARLRSSLALDVTLVVLVLILTAILTGTAPPVR